MSKIATINMNVKISNAPVIPQVLRRSGQRTWRNSFHAPTKYSRIELNGLRRWRFSFAGFSDFFSAFGASVLAVDFDFFETLSSDALIRVTVASAASFLLFADFATVIVSPN